MNWQAIIWGFFLPPVAFAGVGFMVWIGMNLIDHDLPSAVAGVALFIMVMCVALTYLMK